MAHRLSNPMGARQAQTLGRVLKEVVVERCPLRPRGLRRRVEKSIPRTPSQLHYSESKRSDLDLTSHAIPTKWPSRGSDNAAQRCGFTRADAGFHLPAAGRGFGIVANSRPRRFVPPRRSVPGL
jgi:hypothetical protein